MMNRRSVVSAAMAIAGASTLSLQHVTGDGATLFTQSSESLEQRF